MIKLCCFIAGLLFYLSATAQADVLTSKAFHTPSDVEKNKYALVNYLTKDLDNDYDKLKIIAYWIASHIAYDDYKYSNTTGVNVKELNYKYDILEKRSGICGDFAQLFADMANLAHTGKVSVVRGYVLEGVRSIKKKYRSKDVAGMVGHEWNLVQLPNRKFFVDTTFMARTTLRQSSTNRVSSLHHKLDLRRRGRSHKINTAINDFYFDFIPKTEVRQQGRLHLQDKYIK